MNSLQNKLKLQAASQLYSNRVQNMTQKELIVRSYYKSVYFIEESIKCQKNNDLTGFRDNVDKANILIKNLLDNLTFYDSNGELIEVASNLFAGYNFILEVLGKGLQNNSIQHFDVCIKYLNELKAAFEAIN